MITWVLQRNKDIKIWGWAEPGQSIQVTLNQSQAIAETTQMGKWQISLASQKAGGPYDLKIVTTTGAKNEVILNDVLIGEVWVCSGQSNMEWNVAHSRDSKEEIAAANFPNIRHIKIKHRPSPVPLDDVDAEWTVCSPETVSNYTGVGYFFARRLNQELDVPIGLINSSWGGTRVEPWTPPNGFAQVPELTNIHEQLEMRTPGSDRYQQKLSEHINATQKWIETAKSALAEQKELAASPIYPPELIQVTGHDNPTMLYNGMIHHFIGLPIRGTLWYQGEPMGCFTFKRKKP